MSGELEAMEAHGSGIRTTKLRNFNTRRQFKALLPTLEKLCNDVKYLIKEPIMPMGIQREFMYTLHQFIKQVTIKIVADPSPNTSAIDEDDSSNDVKRHGSQGSCRSLKKPKIDESSSSDIFRSHEHKAENGENMAPTLSISNRTTSVPSVHDFGLGPLPSEEPDSWPEFYKQHRAQMEKELSELRVLRAAKKNKLARIDAELITIEKRQKSVDDLQAAVKHRRAVLRAEKAGVDSVKALVEKSLKCSQKAMSIFDTYVRRYLCQREHIPTHE